MSSIRIIKKGITKLEVDAVVNAANSQLQAGSGVCGAVFEDAGYSMLAAACNKIGHCDTGSAVITPGFNLKAKYIIHAVGPIWNGGNSDEPKKLYGCYRRSLELAGENECHSIAFPLISAGIYGYPKDKAWRNALQACQDYLKNNQDYDIDIYFAVLDDAVLELGEKTMRDLGIAAENVTSSESAPVVRFHKIDEENGYLSNWYMRDFSIDGKTYCCVEQYMMEQKALIFQDFAIAEKIMQTTDQQKMQDLGREVGNFIQAVWDGRKQLIVYKGVLAKFKQNPDLRERLMATGNALPVECSKSDKVWGIGLGMDSPDAADPGKWKGQNLLGFTIQAVREELKR